MTPRLSQHLRHEFSGWRRQGLKVLLPVIALCAVILLVDRFFVSRPPAEEAPSVNDIATRLGLQLDEDPSNAQMLRSLLGRFTPIAGSVQSVRTVLWREDAAHRLWVFEFTASEVVMVSSSSLRPLQRHRAGVTRLGIAVELKEVTLPNWSVLQGGDWPRPWTAEAIQRAQRIDDLWLATDASFVVALARPDRFPLREMVSRNISPEFHPGLLNSALAIDVQRVLDVVNLLDTDAPALARVYRIEGIEVKLPAAQRHDFSGVLPRREVNPGGPPISLEQVLAESEARMAAAQAGADAARQTISADSAAAFSSMRADSERQLAETARRIAEAEARRQARDAELLRRQRERAPTPSDEGNQENPP